MSLDIIADPKDVDLFQTLKKINIGEKSNEIPSDMDLAAKEEQKLRNKDQKLTINLKLCMCIWVIILVSIYLMVVFTLLFLVGYREVYLSDTVLVAILTTTTINVLGLPFVMIKSLFPQSGGKVT